jgi:hypothetical protein
MIALKSRLATLLLTAVSIALPVRAQIIIDPPDRQAWTLVPGTVPAEQIFALSVVSYRYSCAHEYDNQKVVVQDNVINLSFTSKINPVVLCPAIDKPYGPEFKVPALKAGRYKVMMNLLQPCHVQEPMCRMAIPVEEAGTLVVGESDKVSYVVNPSSVPEARDFELKLLSPQFTCNIEYFRTSSVVQDNKITLTFLDKANPAIRCIPEEKMYGPSYKMTALKAGSYEVWAVRLPACVEQGCKILPVPVLAGKLVVTDVPVVRKGWYVNPGEVRSGTAFTLNVVNNEYGTCNTEFERSSLTVQGNAIHVSFVIVNHPDRVCIVDKRPHGPSFQMAALKAGAYPVSVQVLPACMFTTPRCEIGILPFVPPPVDTLHVIQSLGLGGSAPRSEVFAAWRGQALEVTLPSGARGLWQAEVVGLDGKRLAVAPVDAARGTTALRMGRMDRGVAVLRLTSPDKVTQTLRVAVGD